MLRDPTPAYIDYILISVTPKTILTCIYKNITECMFCLLVIHPVQESKYLSNLFNLLTQFRLSAACLLAHKHQDHKLASIISQAESGNLGNRLLLRQQLNDWDRLEVQYLYMYMYICAYIHVRITCISMCVCV